jgi:hypothetical protein
MGRQERDFLGEILLYSSFNKEDEIRPNRSSSSLEKIIPSL